MLKKNLLAGFVNADRLTLSKQELANCFDLVVSGSLSAPETFLLYCKSKQKNRKKQVFDKKSDVLSV